jgi:hypothetical protein
MPLPCSTAGHLRLRRHPLPYQRATTLTDRRIGKKLFHSSVRRKSMLLRQLRRHPRAITLTDRRIGQNLFNEISCPSSNSELGNDFNEFSVHRQTRSSELGNENETMAAGCLSETYHRSTSNDIPSAGGRHITNYCVQREVGSESNYY